MYKSEIILKNNNGLHARPASVFVQEASKFISDIGLIKDGQEYNAKSIMGLLSMGAFKGDILTIVAEGEDEEEAVDTLIELLKNMEK